MHAIQIAKILVVHHTTNYIARYSWLYIAATVSYVSVARTIKYLHNYIGSYKDIASYVHAHLT